MDAPPPGNPAVACRNIVILSDGTGQRGGVYFDEARTNIYKLYRAARCGPDSSPPIGSSPFTIPALVRDRPAAFSPRSGAPSITT